MPSQALRIFARSDAGDSLKRPPRSSLITITATPAAPARPRDAPPEPAGTNVAKQAREVEPDGTSTAPDTDHEAPALPIGTGDAVVLVSPPGRSRELSGAMLRARDELAAEIENLIVNILATSIAYGETVEAAYRRKEQALREVFGARTRGEAAELHRRLSDPHPDDVMAARFAGLVVDRRVRLLGVLADAPRREALAARRHGG